MSARLYEGDRKHDLVPVTLQMKNRDITFVTKDGVARRGNILARSPHYRQDGADLRGYGRGRAAVAA